VATAIELENNGQRKKCGQQSRQFVEPNDWQSITDHFENTLELIIPNRNESGVNNT